MNIIGKGGGVNQAIVYVDDEEAMKIAQEDFINEHLKDRR